MAERAGETGCAEGPALGVSPAMRRIDELVSRIADADVPVLITGESGVGKDVVARAIHARSTRAERAFVKINCAALPGELLESELFGHERGSFTGAQRQKPGQFELANGGVLFLDEIGEMPVAMQAKLLQALQDGEFYRVGGQQKVRVDTRVLVATNVDLATAIARGHFREDLYYRLDVVQIAIPPLRERREDILQLLELFIDKHGRREGRSLAELPQYVIDAFLAYDYPGNIRELENLVRRLIVLGDPRYVLSEMQPQPSAPPSGGTAAAAEALSPGRAPDPGPDDYRIDLKELGRRAAHAAERQAIVIMLAHTGGNKREAAVRLGISYKAVLYKIREFGLGRPRRTRPLSLPPALPPTLPEASPEATPQASMESSESANPAAGVTPTASGPRELRVEGGAASVPAGSA